MFCIKYTVDGETGQWIDPNVRGNREPMTYHDRSNADAECELLVRQYCQEGYHFFVDKCSSITA